MHINNKNLFHLCMSFFVKMVLELEELILFFLEGKKPVLLEIPWVFFFLYKDFLPANPTEMFDRTPKDIYFYLCV